MKLFRKGVVAGDYDSGRDANSIVSYMRKHSGPSSKKVETVEEAKKLVARSEVSVIGIFPNTGSLLDVFLKLADKHRENFRFLHTTSKEVGQAFGFPDSNKVLIQFAPHYESKLEGPIVFPYEGVSTVAAFEAFLLEHTAPLVGQYSATSKPRYELLKSKTPGLPLFITYYKVDYANNVKSTNYWRNRVLQVANKFKGKALFAIADKAEYSQFLGELGVADRELAVGLEHEGKKYVMTPEFSVANFETFVNDFLAGSVLPHIKSEPIPTEQTDVKVVVGRNFDEVVFDSKADILLEFYAPWCGHCKNLEPVYKELAQKLKGEESVIIAKIDATANDFPRDVFPVQGYPSIFWVPANDKKNPKKYSGDRDVKSFIDFIKKEATTPLSLSKKKKSSSSSEETKSEL